MTYKIAGYRFDGPYGLDSDMPKLRSKPGVYVILGKDSDHYSYPDHVFDVGVSDNVRARVENFYVQGRWDGEYKYLSVAADYATEIEVLGKIAMKVRKEYNLSHRKKS